MTNTIDSMISVHDPTLPNGCILRPDNSGKNGLSYSALFNTVDSDTQSCGKGVMGPFQGFASSLLNVSVALDPSNAKVTVTLTGPADVWFGIGWNAGLMADTPYAFIVEATGNVFERRLVNHGPGVVLNATITVISNTVISNTRTVVLTRAVQGADERYYTFPSAPGTIRFINAVGAQPTISYHKHRTAAQLTLLPTTTPACLCVPKTVTYLSYMNSSITEYNVHCSAEPRGDMLAQHNPACHMETYHGGLACCKHLWFLTDVAQETLIPAAIDTYYLKFRFYFQEYVPATASTPASHQRLHHWVFLIDDAINDYEETKCQGPHGFSSKGRVFCVCRVLRVLFNPSVVHLTPLPSVPSITLTLTLTHSHSHTGTWCEASISAHLKARDMGLEDTPASYSGIQLHVITAHCHAPSCISQVRHAGEVVLCFFVSIVVVIAIALTVWHTTVRALFATACWACVQELYNADTGQLICRVHAIYGNSTEAFNERGYEALPPCLFGFQEGLMPPPVLAPDTNLMAVKIFNNTYRHLGQMAQWTGLMVYLP